ncbi:hypothetical protein HYT05_03075 [Candidatus Kaiserbacteria bacterium]|nr:hypothetical protein [Candidatus Kaiserbacteria bacterium]
METNTKEEFHMGHKTRQQHFLNTKGGVPLPDRTLSGVERHYRLPTEQRTPMICEDDNAPDPYGNRRGQIHELVGDPIPLDMMFR